MGAKVQVSSVASPPVSQVGVVQIEVNEGSEPLQAGDAPVCEADIGQVQLRQMVQTLQMSQACKQSVFCCRWAFCHFEEPPFLT